MLTKYLPFDNPRALLYWRLSYALFLFALAFVSDFAVLGSDALVLFSYARGLDLTDPGTFYNGFFPAGYGILLRFLDWLPFLTINQAAILFNIGLSLIYLGSVHGLTYRFIEQRFRGVVFAGALFVPAVLRYTLTATPDYAITVALIWLIEYVTRRDTITKSDLLKMAGVIAVASLFRTHAVLYLFMVWLVVEMSPNFVKRTKMPWLILPSLLGYVIQGLIQVWSGHGFAETMQGFNVYRMMHNVDWQHPPYITASPLAVIAREPGLFIAAYLFELELRLWTTIPFVIILFVIPKWRAVAVGAIFYILATTTAASARGTIPVQPLAVIGWGLLADFGLKYLKAKWQSREFIAALTFVVAFIGAGGAILGAVHARERISVYREIENEIAMRSTITDESILSDDFSFYFPQADVQPFHLGGWGVVGLKHHREIFQKLEAGSGDSLNMALTQLSITSAVWKKNSGDTRLKQLVRTEWTLIADRAEHEIYLGDHSTQSGGESK